MVGIVWEWWETSLTQAQRDALLGLEYRGIPQEVAEQLWRASPLPVLHAEPDPDSPVGYIWRLDHEIADFVAERHLEHRAGQRNTAPPEVPTVGRGRATAGQLWDWWEGTLNDAQRHALMASVDLPLPRTIAVDVLHVSYPLAVVEVHLDPFSREGSTWTLTREVAAFVAERELELRHPEDFR
jgi:hypothetical protein